MLSSTQKKFISVILPIYEVNGATYKCMDTILSQSYTHFEVLCANMMASADDFINSYVKKDKRVVSVLKNDNEDILNQALARAKGEYITIVNANDYLLTDMLEKLVAHLVEKNIDIVKGNYYELENNSDLSGLDAYLSQERNSTICYDHSFSLGENPEILWGKSSIWNTLYKKDFLDSNNVKLDKHLNQRFKDTQDHFFFVKSLICAESIVWTNESSYCHMNTMNLESDSKEEIIENLNTMQLCLEELNETYGKNYMVMKVWYAKIMDYIRKINNKYNLCIPNEIRIAIKNIVKKMDENIINDKFNSSDQKLYYDILSPIKEKKELCPKVLIYNWLPYDNPWRWGGGVTVYCKNIIEELLKKDPSLNIYFLSSGFAYDATRTYIYVRKVSFTEDERVHQMEIVNSPVPAEQRWLYVNPLVALENNDLKTVFCKFVETYGPFKAIHFNNIEGLSLDVLDLKEKFNYTKFIYSLHNYVPLCVNGSYYMRHKHCNCSPDHTPEDCYACTRADIRNNIAHETYMRGVWGEAEALVSELYWIEKLGFARLDEDVSVEKITEFSTTAIEKINKNCDSILAVSKRVYEIAAENGIDESKMKVSYIGTKVADNQLGHVSTERCDGILKIVFLGNDLFYEEKGYPFLMDALSKLDAKYASKIDLLLTVKQKEHAQMYQQLENFRSVKIVNGYTHDDFKWIFEDCHLSIVPVLWEDNLPQIAIESVAYGVPVLASSAGGASELTNSPLFKFECGDENDMLNKIKYFVDNPSELLQYWESHAGLVTLEEHIKELIEIYGINGINQNGIIQFTYEEFLALLKEKNFLMEHFEKGKVECDVEKSDEREELQKAIEQKKYLQYVIDETRKSKTYKIGRIITAIPRKLRKNQ